MKARKFRRKGSENKVKAFFESEKGKRFIRRALLALLVLLTALFQNTRGALPAIGNAKAMPLIVLAATLGLFERSLAGLFFGAFAGALWDMASADTDGFFTLLLCAVGFLSGVLSSFVLRNNIFSALLLSGSSTAICLLLHWFGFVYVKGYDPAAALLVSRYLPSAIYTFLFTFVCYYLVRGIANAFSMQKKFESF